MKKKNRIQSLKLRGIINIVYIEHQGNASFVQMYRYMVEFYPNTCRIINGNKEPSTGNSGYQRGN